MIDARLVRPEPAATECRMLRDDFGWAEIYPETVAAGLDVGTFRPRRDTSG